MAPEDAAGDGNDDPDTRALSRRTAIQPDNVGEPSRERDSQVGLSGRSLRGALPNPAGQRTALLRSSIPGRVETSSAADGIVALFGRVSRGGLI